MVFLTIQNLDIFPGFVLSFQAFAIQFAGTGSRR